MTEPKCKYFGKCGGCSAQHIDYKLQLSNKKNVMSHALKNTNYEGEIKVFSGNPYNYRNRMDFIFTRNGIGFRKKGDWKHTINISECEISNSRLNKLLNEVRTFFIKAGYDYFDLIKQSGAFRYAVIRTPNDDSSISFVLNQDSTKLDEATEKIKAFARVTTAKNIIVTYVPYQTDSSTSNEYYVIKGSDVLHETFDNKKLGYSVQGFFQNNSDMAEEMISYAKDLLKSYNPQNANLLDLYGGVGSFGIICSELFRSVTIVENFAGSIDSAKINLKNNNIENGTALVMDSKSINKLDLRNPLYVITDPPRSGMIPKAIERLIAHKPEVIIYVSCNIKQLGKELPRFKGYVVKSAAIFDLFPQTPHCEGVLELIKEKV